MLFAVIHMNIIATTSAALHHLVRTILKSDFMMIFKITDEPTWDSPDKRSNSARFQRINTLKAVDL